MAFSDDLIVDDAYIAAVSGNLRSLYEALGESFQQYTSILRQIRDHAISEGDTHEAVAAFCEMSNTLYGKFDTLGGAYGVTIDCFAGDIDEADKYIY